MTTITEALTDPKRRLLNLLYDHRQGHGTTADPALQHADIGLEETDELIRSRLIRATDPTGIEMERLHSRRLLETHLKLTVTGRGWVRLNPENRLIRSLDGYERGRFTLAVADRVAQGDRGLVLGLVTNGYATLHYAGDLKETRFDTATGREEFRFPRDYVFLPTAKVKQVLVDAD